MANRRSSRRPFRANLPFAPKPDPLFRWRGTGVSRLEGLADAVFAFTVTLLVVALEVPRDFNDLMRIFEGFPAFAATFAILMWFWSTHYIFFRRYGLEDAWTRVINTAILLCVVFIAYPLKFIFNAAFTEFVGIGEFTTGINSLADLTRLYTIYGAGLATVSLGFLLLYTHAYRKRHALQLSEAEIIITRGSLCRILINILVCLISIILAHVSTTTWLPGVTYSLLGPLIGVNEWWHGKRAEQVAAAPKDRPAHAPPHR